MQTQTKPIGAVGKAFNDFKNITFDCIQFINRVMVKYKADTAVITLTLQTITFCVTTLIQIAQTVVVSSCQKFFNGLVVVVENFN